jgi:hypothetical protein
LSSPHAWGKDTISADIDESKNTNPLINKELFPGGYDLDAMWRSQEKNDVSALCNKLVDSVVTAFGVFLVGI